MATHSTHPPLLALAPPPRQAPLMQPRGETLGWLRSLFPCFDRGFEFRARRAVRSGRMGGDPELGGGCGIRPFDESILKWVRRLTGVQMSVSHGADARCRLFQLFAGIHSGGFFFFESIARFSCTVFSFIPSNFPNLSCCKRSWHHLRRGESSRS
jgi:hypothetical protein